MTTPPNKVTALPEPTCMLATPAGEWVNSDEYIVLRTTAAAQIEALKKDAERYRWLRGNAPSSSTRWPRWRIEYWCGSRWDSPTKEDLDAMVDEGLLRDSAIDDAIARKP